MPNAIRLRRCVDRPTATRDASHSSGERAPAALRASDAFAQTLDRQRTRSGSPAGELVGLEHEYQVFEGGAQLDFRELIHGFRLSPRFLDPSDPNAYHLPSGAMLTCDYREAEIVTPPVRRGPGFSREIERRARSAREAVELLLAPDVELVGYSTHVSVSMADALTEQVALRYTRTFAPALMLLLNRTTSPGLLVRPRPGRLELCGEFIEGAHLRAVLTFALGSALACAAAVDGWGDGEGPPEVRLRVDPAYERYGWYVDRRAGGADLHVLGRRTPLPLAEGGVIDAQLHLERAWRAARHALGRAIDRDDADLVECMVSGVLSLPSEGPAGAEAERPQPSLAAGPFGDLLRPRCRRRVELVPVMVTWAACVFLVVDVGRTRRAFACVPREYLEAFLHLLDTGRIDALLWRYLTGEPDERALRDWSQTGEPGLYDELGPRRGLLMPEREAGSNASAAPVMPRPPRRWPWWPLHSARA